MKCLKLLALFMASTLTASSAHGAVVLGPGSYLYTNSDTYGGDFKQQNNNTVIATSVTSAGPLLVGTYAVDSRGTATVLPNPSDFAIFQFQGSANSSDTPLRVLQYSDETSRTLSLPPTRRPPRTWDTA